MSNTEQMVSVPREWVENYAGLLEERCTYEASERVQVVLAQPAAQHQGEPVALPARKAMTAHGLTALDSEAEGWNAYHDEIAKLGPLYTHPAPPVPHGKPAACATIEVAPTAGQPKARVLCFDSEQLPMGSKVKVYTHADAGEVERLRAELESVKSSRDAFAQNAIDLRAQLAEREAALDALTEIATGYKLDLDEAHALLRGIHDGEISGFERYSKIEALLSASAEPKSCGACDGCTNGCQLEKDSPSSAPVEIDERAKVQEALFWLDDFVARCNGDDRGSCSAIETLRAALDRKS